MSKVKSSNFCFNFWRYWTRSVLTIFF